MVVGYLRRGRKGAHHVMATQKPSLPEDLDDGRPFHDHGDWKGPCGDARHELIKAGGPGDPKTPAERARYLLEWMRASSEGLRCACCRAVLIADTTHVSAIIETAKSTP